MHAIAFCLADAFGVGLLNDPASSIGPSDTLAFTSSVLQAITFAGQPAVAFLWLGGGAEG